MQYGLEVGYVKRIREAIRLVVIYFRHAYLRHVYGMDIAPSARISFGTKLDKTNPGGIHIGAESYFASGAIMFSHDFSRGIRCDTYVGRRCFIGANAILMAGITIGDEVVVGSGAVVTRDVPSHAIVAGNPARVLREGIRTGKFGKIQG